MTTHYYISKSWIVSRSARRVYQVASVFSMGLFVFLVLAYLAPGTLRPSSPPAQAMVGVLLRLTVLGTAITLVAMEFFLFTYDQSPPWKMFLWFLIMVILGLGAALYCLLVYSRSEYFQSVGTNSPDPEHSISER